MTQSTPRRAYSWVVLKVFYYVNCDKSIRIYDLLWDLHASQVSFRDRNSFVSRKRAGAVKAYGNFYGNFPAMVAFPEYLCQKKDNFSSESLQTFSNIVQMSSTKDLSKLHALKQIL